MAGSRSLIAALALALGPGAALACSPSPATVTDAPMVKDSCSVHWAQEEYRVVGLGPVADLGGGLTVQAYFDGNACYWQSGIVVQDCAAGEAVVIGPDSRALADGPTDMGADRIETALAAMNGAATLKNAVALAAAEGYGAPRAFRADVPLTIGGVALPRECACETLYPDTAGGTN